MPRAGERVGRFEVVREIGRGGMAVVYLARQTDLDRNVALKQLGAFHATDPAAAARFLQESRITGSLGHPNIVTVHEYLQHDDGTPYIAMEYLERGSLRPMVRTLSIAQFAGVMEGVLAALSHAAEQGIVHRDLKPENLMLTRAGTVKVADFGIAKAVNEVQTSYATATGTTVGTPAYMSPEQAMAKGVGPSTDLYAVGVMAYEMLVGRVPYSADTPVAVLLQHVNEPLPGPREAKPDLDPELAAWLESMLAKTPDGRPEDAAAAWDSLEGIVIGILGPRWRRDARLLEQGAPAVAEPLTPAPFESVQSPATPAPGVAGPPAVAATPGATELPPAAPAPAAPAAPPVAPAPTGFETFGRPGSAPDAPATPPAPAAPPPVAPAPTGFQTFARPGAAAEAGSEAPEAPPAGAPPDGTPPSVDGFQTFDPQPRSAPPPPAPPPPPEPPPPAPAPPPEPPAAETAAPAEAVDETVPPRSREVTPDTPIAVPSPGGPKGGGPDRRRLAILGGGAAAIAAIVVVVVLVAGGGGGGDDPEAPPPTTAPTGPVVPDRVLEERPDLTASGGTLLVADPAGRVLRMDGGRATATLRDPSGPIAVAAAGDRVVVADSSAVTTATADDLSPVAASAFPGAVGLATAGQDVAVANGRDGRGRVCLVGERALGPCADLSFAPTGLGASGDTIFAADGAAGTVVPLSRSGGALAAGTPIPIGTKPHGRMVEDRGRLYVPVERGVGAIDLATGASVGTFAMPTTPADLAIRDDGLLAAALPASDQVAVVDTTKPAAEPALVAVGGTPASLAATDDGIQALTTQGDLVPVDVAAGTAAAGAPIPGFGAAAKPVTLRRVSSAAAERRVTLTLALSGGTLANDGLRVADKSIADGRAALELWQGGIRSDVRQARGGGVRVSVSPRTGRLLVALSAGAGDFTAMSARLVRDGAAVQVVLTKPAPKPEPTTPEPSTPSGGGGSPTPTPTPTPTPNPTPPSDPGFETG